MKIDPCCFAKGCDYATYPHGRGIFIFNVRKCYTIMENKVNAYRCLVIIIELPNTDAPYH